MTNKMKIKRLKKQNENLIEQNIKLRKKIPTKEYAKRIDKDIERFESINDDLLKLYKELHKCSLQNKRTAWKYMVGVFCIKIKQFFGI
ncbi:MAG: hypothetical protein J1E62_05460 [Lachnospiraceae bacterium]|nr:hypothetical protein [Lachnospiraceae bacterium]